MPQIISDFAEIEQEFTERVQRVVYCNLATVDARQRPRSRIIHPLWDGTTGWLTSVPNTAKTKQLTANPFVSLAYIAEPPKPVYVECRAVVQNDQATRQRFWELCKRLPEPYGYDLAAIWGEVDSPAYILVRFDAWRIELYDLLDQSNRKEWYAPGMAPSR